MAAVERFKKNPGRCPSDAKGKRVVVRLNNGSECGREPVTTVSPPGWAADGKQGCNWEIDPTNPFAIDEYLVLGSAD